MPTHHDACPSRYLRRKRSQEWSEARTDALERHSTTAPIGGSTVSLTKKTIDAATADRMIAGAIAKVTENGKRMRIAITNEAGQLKTFHAMDGAPHLSV